MGYANRHEVQEYMAELAKTGCIVELGGGYGRGAIALAHGTKRGADLPIYVVDPYMEYKDLLGGEYGPKAQAEFEKNVADAGVEIVHVPLSAEDAAHTWSEPVGMLWIDLTMNYARLKAIFDAWRPHLAECSYIGITGFEYGNPAEFFKLRRVGVIIERTGDEGVKVRVPGFTGG